MAETRTTSSTGGQKGVKLARFDLIPPGPIWELAEHFGRGARKYAPNQWRQGYEWSKSYAAISRHLNEFWSGKDYDTCPEDEEGCSFVTSTGELFEPEEPNTCYNHTGSHHMVAVMWHACVLLEFKDTFPQHDDRFKGSVVDEKAIPADTDMSVVEVGRNLKKLTEAFLATNSRLTKARADAFSAATSRLTNEMFNPVDPDDEDETEQQYFLLMVYPSTGSEWILGELYSEAEVDFEIDLPLDSGLSRITMLVEADVMREVLRDRLSRRREIYTQPWFKFTWERKKNSTASPSGLIMTYGEFFAWLTDKILDAPSWFALEDRIERVVNGKDDNEIKGFQPVADSVRRAAASADRRMNGVESIVERRRQQIEEKGYTLEHDKRHPVHTLVKVAVAYLRVDHDFPEQFSHLKKLGYGYYARENLVNAGAMIAAAIDRLDASEEENQ